MTIYFILFVKPWHDNKFINKSVIPIPMNLLKLLPWFFSYIWHLISCIDKLDNQYIYNSQWYHKWHNLILWKILFYFYISSHKTLIMIKHGYYSFRDIFNSKLCGCTERIIHEFFCLFFKDFIYIQCWIVHISNRRLVDKFFCIIIIYLCNIIRRWLSPNNGNNGKWWQ